MGKVGKSSQIVEKEKNYRRKMMIMKLTFISAWVCMQACVGIHMKRGIIVSPTSVKGRIWTLNEYDDDDIYIYILNKLK